LRIKETKEVYEGEVTELTPVETENPMGGVWNLFVSQTKLLKRFGVLWLVICNMNSDIHAHCGRFYLHAWKLETWDTLLSVKNWVIWNSHISHQTLSCYNKVSVKHDHVDDAVVFIQTKFCHFETY
jgi:hypothetical protein